MEIRFLDVAQQEFDEAVEYYKAELLGLGDQFLLEALVTLQGLDNFQERGISIPKMPEVRRRLCTASKLKPLPAALFKHSPTLNPGIIQGNCTGPTLSSR